MRTPRHNVPLVMDVPPASAVDSMSRAMGLPRLMASMLVKRGLTTSTARSFLSPTEGLSDNPLKMKGMREVAGRVAKAVTSKERVLIYGDYDADGIPATALLVNWLRAQRVPTDFYIPRREAGYGMSLAAAKEIAARPTPPQLVISVDCGSSDHEAVKYLRDKGIDVIITDHHLTLKGNPPTPYFINPSRSDGETYPFTGFCGCGVAYKLIQALTGRPVPLLYDLVMLSTVGDQVPLLAENRYYVQAGLAAVNRNSAGNLGLRAIVETCKRSVTLSTLTAEDIAFQICPRINAVGRMSGDPNEVVELLTTSDHNRASELANKLERANMERRDLTTTLFEEAARTVGSNPPDIIVAILPECPIGVAGLVAAKISEYYLRPALVTNKEGRGSGRAPRGMDLMPFMQQLKSAGVFGTPRRDSRGETVIPDFGGHAGACGFHNVDPYRLKSAASSLRVQSDRRGALAIEAEGTLAELTDSTLKMFPTMLPYGIGNPEPTILFKGLTVKEKVDFRTRLVMTVTDGAGTEMRATWAGAGVLTPEIGNKVDLVGYPLWSSYSNCWELKILTLITK